MRVGLTAALCLLLFGCPDAPEPDDDDSAPLLDDDDAADDDDSAGPLCDDTDGDGYGDDCPAGPDCDDTDPEVHPGAVELCDGADTDCDDAVPDDEVDADGDGWAACSSSLFVRAAWPEAVLGGGDCADDPETAGDVDRNPAADEVCDSGVDENCDGDVDCADASCVGHSRCSFWADVVVGDRFTMGLRLDGSIERWGTPQFSSVPVLPGSYTAIGIGSTGGCAAKAEGGVVSWSSWTNGVRPVPTEPLVYDHVGCGDSHQCASTATGQVRCWGLNDHGQAADRTGYAVDASGGSSLSCALSSPVEGSISCWGDDSYGVVSGRPSGNDIVDIGLNSVWHCVLRSGGGVVCWGLGNPPSPPASGVTKMAVGHNAVCGIMTAGNIECWGAPWSLAGEFRDLDVGYNHLCGIRTDDTMVCVGDNENGQLDVP